MKKILNHFLLFNLHPSKDDQERKYKIAFLNHVFFFAGIVAFGMGFIRWQESILMGMVDFVFSGLSFALLYYLRQHKEKIELLSSLALMLSFILFFAIFLFAPHNTTRSSLFFLLSASAFFLKGRKTGFLWLIFILFSIVSGYFLLRSNMAYSRIDILTLSLYLIALFFIFDNYESIKEEQKYHLEKLNMHLEEEIENRTKELRNTVVELSKEITERKLAEHQLRIAAIAFESQEGMIVTDANKVILRVNRAFTNISGYSAEEAIGQMPSMIKSDRHNAAFYNSMWESIYDTGGWEGEVRNRRKNGEVYPQHLIITAVKDAAGNVTNYVASLTDATKEKIAAEKIHQLAFYDPLTGLPNRRLLLDRLSHAFAANMRNGQEGALLFLDLDYFKTLNDTRGHDIGDLLLQQVAERLTACVREGDTVARLGGDEFVIMLEALNEHAVEAAAQAEVIANKILTAFNQPFQLTTQQHQCTASIGVTLFNHHDQSQEELLKHADIAMYQAKKAGRNTLRFFDPIMQEAINTRAEMEHDLRKALENKEFQLYYQVQVDGAGHPLGAEALIRWIHPKRGMVSPMQFISLAEETRLILPIGLWVLETACAQLKAWAQHTLTRDLTISINVSAKQFNQADFVDQVQAAVQNHAINPMLLKLELTESMLIDNIDNIIITMVALQAIGVRFELDDFGTGYSSLQYLKQLPLYQLKIDQSFVRDIATDSSDQAIVRTIVAMAQSLKLEVIAEGVETEGQLAYLRNYGCNHFQGYLFGRPVPIEQLEEALEQGQITL